MPIKSNILTLEVNILDLPQAVAQVMLLSVSKAPAYVCVSNVHMCMETFDYEDWRKATDLTLLSAVSLIKHALPHLKQSNRASVLAIVSIAAKQPVENLTLSNTIRPAVVGLTKSLSLELGEQNIRFNTKI